MPTLPRAAWIILAVALAIRIGAIVVGPDYTPVGDAADYDRHAVSIAQTAAYPESRIAAEGGPTAFRPPVYTYALGAVYALTGNSQLAGLLLQALLGTAVVALIGMIAWQVWDRRVALVAMGVGAVYPPLIVLGASLLSEPLFLVLELAAIGAAFEHRRSPRGYRWAIACGLLIGLATLTRVNGIILAPVLALYMWGAAPLPWSLRGARPAALALGVALLVIAPWSIRNTIELDEFIPFTTQDSISLARNYNELSRTDPVYPSAPHDPPRTLELVRDPALNEAEVATELGGEARSYMLDHPGFVVQTIARNLVRSVHLDGAELGEAAAKGEGIDLDLARLGIYSFYGFALLALVGAFLPLARRAPWVVWVTPVLAMLPAMLIAAGRTRYRAPIEPAVVILAGISLLLLWERIGARRGAGARPSTAEGAPRQP